MFTLQQTQEQIKYFNALVLGTRTGAEDEGLKKFKAKANTSSCNNPGLKTWVIANNSLALALILSKKHIKARTNGSGFIIGINVSMDIIPVWVCSPVSFLFLRDSDRNASTTPV